MAAISSLSTDDLAPNVYEHLIQPTLVAYEGLGRLIDDIRENNSLRSALLLRSATVLRERLQKLNYEASTAEPITIEAQDALVLLDLLMRRLG